MSIPASDCDLAEGVPAKRVPRQAEQEFAGDTFIHYLSLYTANSARSDIIMMILLSADTDLMHYFIIIYNS